MAESRDPFMASAHAARMQEIPADDTPAGVGYKRPTLEFTLADSVADEMTQLAEITGLSPHDLIATAISLLSVVVRGKAFGRRLLLTTKAFWPVKEFVLPSQTSF